MGYFGAATWKNYCRVWNHHLEFVKMQRSMLRKKIWDKNCFIWVLWDWNLKKLLSHLKSKPLDLSKCKVSCKTKKLWVRNQKCLILVLLGENFKKKTVILEISTLEFVKMRSSMLKVHHACSKEKEKQLWKTAVFRQLIFSTKEL